MNDFASTLLLSTVPAILVGLVTAWASVRLALGRFRAERWFDRKTDAYAQLFSALANIQRNCSVQLERIEEGAKYRDDYLGNLAALAAAGSEEIRKSATIGEFLFGERSSTLLLKLERDIEKAHAQRDLHDIYEDESHVVADAIQKLRALAKADLARPWWR